LQQYVVADVNYITKIPEGISSEAAAPLLCAGVTMAGAIAKLEPELQEGDWLVISGAGGGLGHIGVQIASRLNKFRVIAVDAGQDKRALSLESGAETFVDYLDDDLEARIKQLTGGEGAHGILVVPGTRSAFEVAPALVRNMGVIVCVGLPSLDFQLPISATVCTARGKIQWRAVSSFKASKLTELLKASRSKAPQLVQRSRWKSYSSMLLQGLLDQPLKFLISPTSLKS
jgi:propanol-preferring alcohol dehydrogenase